MRIFTSPWKCSSYTPALGASTSARTHAYPVRSACESLACPIRPMPQFTRSSRDYSMFSFRLDRYPGGACDVCALATLGIAESSHIANAAATGLHPRPKELVGNIFSHRAHERVYLPAHTLRGRR